MRLIACWMADQEAFIDEPESVMWGDGTPATIHDYRKHMFDTNDVSWGRFGEIYQHFYPDVVAEVFWDTWAKDWAARVPGRETFGLDLHDPNATDRAIAVVLSSFPVVYRANISRPRQDELTDGAVSAVSGA